MRKTLFHGLAFALVGTVSLASPGDPDGTFGDGGRVLTRLSTSGLHYDSASALIFRRGLAPVVVGTLGDNSSIASFAMVALDELGRRDVEFGHQGVSAIRLPWTKSVAAIPLADGTFMTLIHRYRGFMLAKFWPDGDLDHRFGLAGTVTAVVTDESMEQGMEPVGLARDADGRFLVLGYAPLGTQQTLFIAAFRANGSVDRKFGRNGVVFDDVMTAGRLVLSQGKLIVAGKRDPSSLEIRRYDGQGAPDGTFGEGGRVVTRLPGLESLWLGEFVSDDRGGFYAAGSAKSVDSRRGVLFAARFGPDGKLDERFGSKGCAEVHFEGRLEALSGGKVVVDRLGRPVLFGTLVDRALPDPNVDRAIGVARLTSNGELDPTFGRNGTSHVVERTSFVLSGALDVADRLVVVGAKSLDEAPFTTAWLTRRFRME